MNRIMVGVLLCLLPLICPSFSQSPGSGGAASVYYTEEPRSQAAFEGSTVVLRCGVNDRTNVQFYWIKDSLYLVNTSRVYEEAGFLTVLRVNRKDAGSYKCVASNIAIAYVLFSKPALLTVKTTQSSDSSPMEVDLLKLLGKPAENSDVSFTFGLDGYPAFQVKPSSKFTATAFKHFGGLLQENFAIVALFKPEVTQHGYFLFAVVNPAGKITLGLRIMTSSTSKDLSHVILYYTENELSMKSNVLANFSLPAFKQEWRKIALKVQGEFVTLYVDCEEIEKVTAKRSSEQLKIPSGSAVFVGQAGEGHSGIFIGSFQILKVFYDPKEAEDTDSCEELLENSNSGSGSGGTLNIDDEKGGTRITPSVTDFKGKLRAMKGEKGDQGLKGSPGMMGIEGKQGPPGMPQIITPPPPDISGLTGEKGDKGDDGKIGLPGELGTPGHVGQKGEKGELGVDGKDGVIGQTGAKGDIGPQGDKGEMAVGIPGDKGEAGQNGHQGPPGSVTMAQQKDPVKGDKGDLGEKGERGEMGLRGLIGSVGPAGSPGPPGLPGPPGDATDGSGNIDSVPGPRGPQGLPGQSGPQGVRGVKGDTGVKGNDGSPSIQGVAGLRGLTGESGQPGYDGQNGSKGVVGPDGIQGPQGYEGPKGTKGMVGAEGPQGQRGLHGLVGPAGHPGPPGKTVTVEGTNNVATSGEPGTPGQPGQSGADGEPGQQGLRGYPGESGDMGKPGHASPKGSKGEQGIQGLTGIGVHGPPGPPGPAGSPGLIGVPGLPGSDRVGDGEGSGGVETPTPASKGVKGDKGESGLSIEGPLGPAGKRGPMGPPGFTGNTGLEGVDGSSGSKGDKGDLGLAGPQGPPGPAGVVAEGNNGGEPAAGKKGERGDDGVCTKECVSIEGEKGSMGERGTTGLRGGFGKSGMVGMPGFPGRSGLRGRKGEKGTEGQTEKTNRGVFLPGPRGNPGLPGIVGPVGQRGQRGYPGPPGTSVDNETGQRTGERGPKGPPGDDGESGEKGMQGIKGEKGESSVVTGDGLSLGGPPGPPGPKGQMGEGRPGRPGQPGESIVGQRGPPGLSGSQTGSGGATAAATTYSSQSQLVAASHNIAVGSLAYIIDQQQVYVRVDHGWRLVQLGPIIPLPMTTKPRDMPSRAKTVQITRRKNTSTQRGAVRTTYAAASRYSYSTPDDKHLIDLSPVPSTAAAHSSRMRVTRPRASSRFSPRERERTRMLLIHKKRLRYREAMRRYYTKQRERMATWQKEQNKRRQVQLRKREEYLKRARQRSHRVRAPRSASLSMLRSSLLEESTSHKRHDPRALLYQHGDVLAPKLHPLPSHRRHRGSNLLYRTHGRSFTEVAEQHGGAAAQHSLQQQPSQQATSQHGGIRVNSLQRTPLLASSSHRHEILQPLTRNNLTLAAPTEAFPQYPSTTTVTTEEPDTTRGEDSTIEPPKYGIFTGARVRLIALNHPHKGNLHGIHIADYKCHQQAFAAGLSGTFRAFLSSDVQNLESIIHFQRDRQVPVVNIKDEVLFKSWNNMLNEGGVLSKNATIYSFSGKNVVESNTWPQKLVWHGSTSAGLLSGHYCRGWRARMTSRTGSAGSLLKNKLLDTQQELCSQSFIILCIENTSQTLRR